MSQKEALKILEMPHDKLRLASDYYKAAYHLCKFPGIETENALLKLLKIKSKEMSILIAQKKAMETLSMLGCRRSIETIISYLDAEDPLVVESAVLALTRLQYSEIKLIKKISYLLYDSKQNTRVLIQYLAQIKAVSEVSRIKKILKNSIDQPMVAGAAISAIIRLSKEKEQLYMLKEFLFISNQNDRHCALNDIIETGETIFIKDIIKSPISPSFKYRAFIKLFPNEKDLLSHDDLIKMLDTLIMGDPRNIKVIEEKNQSYQTNYLIEQLFSTDFNKAYLALQILLNRQAEQLWPYINIVWKRLEKDYGAIYFFMLLFRYVKGWNPIAIDRIISLARFSIGNYWPNYMKFKPVSIMTLIHLDPDSSDYKIDNFFDENITQYWVSRYSALVSINLILNRCKSSLYENSLFKCLDDSNIFIRYKAKLMLEQL